MLRAKLAIHTVPTLREDAYSLGAQSGSRNPAHDTPHTSHRMLWWATPSSHSLRLPHRTSCIAGSEDVIILSCAACDKARSDLCENSRELTKKPTASAEGVTDHRILLRLDEVPDRPTRGRLTQPARPRTPCFSVAPQPRFVAQIFTTTKANGGVVT